VGRAEPRALTTAGGLRFWVRTAEPADAAATLRLENHMHDHHPFKLTERGEIDRDEPAEREWIGQHLDNPCYLMLIACDAPAAGAGEALGRITFRNGNRRKLAHHGTFGIAVHSEWRGKGVGSALIATLLDWAAAHPTIEKVGLGVFASNSRARALYRRMGFTKEGVSPRHFKIGSGTYDDDVMMSIFVKPGLAPQPFHTWTRQGPEGPQTCG
jgi:RimJ/RimL family protein N-acetyltransferase